MGIEIVVDEKACVGCTLCVDACPTKVFEFDDEKKRPVVEKPAECFGCLSCSEICPATAIDHANIPHSQCYYHDPYALTIASRLGGQSRVSAFDNTSDALKSAFGDLEVRLLAVAAVLKQTLGQSLPAIGTQAGRSLAGQLPRYREPSTIEEALELTRSVFAPAWNLDMSLTGQSLTVTVGDCVVRDLCHKRSLELGGDLCILFYGYLAGYLSKQIAMRPRLMNANRGTPTCVYTIQLYPSQSE